MTPHVAKSDMDRVSNLDLRSMRQLGYAVNLSWQWLIDKCLGRLMQTGPLRLVKL